jgi:hypothetical protein
MYSPAAACSHDAGVQRFSKDTRVSRGTSHSSPLMSRVSVAARKSWSALFQVNRRAALKLCMSAVRIVVDSFDGCIHKDADFFLLRFVCRSQFRSPQLSLWGQQANPLGLLLLSLRLAGRRRLRSATRQLARNLPTTDHHGQQPERAEQAATPRHAHAHGSFAHSKPRVHLDRDDPGPVLVAAAGHARCGARCWRPASGPSIADEGQLLVCACACVLAALRRNGLESCNMIVGIDCASLS